MNKYTNEQYELLEAAYRLLQQQYNTERDTRDKYRVIEQKRHAREVQELNDQIKALKGEIDLLRYSVKGACAEHLHLRVEVSPYLLESVEARRATQYISENAAKRLSYAVEKNLGDRYELIKEYDRALRHIHYLEHHASAHCIKFTPFGMPKKFN